MKCQLEIEEMADLRLKESYCLLENKFWDGAYYLAGYSIELLLKARICKTLGIDDFFVFDKAKKELYRPYKVHNFQELVILSGIYSELMSAQSDITFKSQWSLVCEWEESSRYLMGRNEKKVTDFVISIKEMSEWIKGKL